MGRIYSHVWGGKRYQSLYSTQTMAEALRFKKIETKSGKKVVLIKRATRPSEFIRFVGGKPVTTIAKAWVVWVANKYDEYPPMLPTRSRR